ncbi:hypothetical protein CI238_00058, partial [Colletotrichum incanum]
LLRAVVELDSLVDRLSLGSRLGRRGRLLRVNRHGIAVLAIGQLLQYRLGTHALDDPLGNGDVCGLRHEAGLIEALPFGAGAGTELHQARQHLLVLRLLRFHVRRAFGEGSLPLLRILLLDLRCRLLQPGSREALQVLDVLVEGSDVARGYRIGVENPLHEDGLMVLVELPSLAGRLPVSEVLKGGLDVGGGLLRRRLGRLLRALALLPVRFGGGGVLDVVGKGDRLLLPQGRGCIARRVVRAGPFEGGAERRGSLLIETFPFGGGGGGGRGGVGGVDDGAAGVPVVVLLPVGLRSLGRSRAANLCAGCGLLELEAQSFPGRDFLGGGHDGQRAHPLLGFSELLFSEFLWRGGRRGACFLGRCCFFGQEFVVCTFGQSRGAESAELGRFDAFHV